MEAIPNLNPSATQKIHALIRANVANCRGLEQAADTVANEGIALTFRFFARQRGESAAELERYVGRCDLTPGQADGAAFATAAEWLNVVRGSRGGGDDQEVLVVAERAEEAIRRQYEEALRETAGTVLNGVLSRQYREVQAGYEMVSTMRGSV